MRRDTRFDTRFDDALLLGDAPWAVGRKVNGSTAIDGWAAAAGLQGGKVKGGHGPNAGDRPGDTVSPDLGPIPSERRTPVVTDEPEGNGPQDGRRGAGTLPSPHDQAQHTGGETWRKYQKHHGDDKKVETTDTGQDVHVARRSRDIEVALADGSFDAKDKRAFKGEQGAVAARSVRKEIRATLDSAATTGGDAIDARKTLVALLEAKLARTRGEDPALAQKIEGRIASQREKLGPGIPEDSPFAPGTSPLLQP